MKNVSYKDSAMLLFFDSVRR